MIEMRKTQEAGKTPAQITVSMIDQDLKDGVNKTEMAVKYGIKPWEVDEMFKHPILKGRRPARKRVLSFTFVDDTLPLNSGDIAVEQAEEVDPNQVTLEQAIDEAIIVVEEVKDQMQETQEAIIDMLSPMEPETFEEILNTVTDESIGETLEDSLKHPDYENQFDREDNDPEYSDAMSDTDDDELELPSFEDTLDLVKEQQEEELEMDDDTFEL
jgi:hypothetical protein